VPDEKPIDPPIDQLMQQLIVQARAVAWRHWHGAPYVLEFEELVSLAYKGLTEAAARWEVYCEKNGYDPSCTRYFSAYCLRRMNGSILDYMRGQDWVSRTVRNRARALREAGQDQGASEAQLSEGSGLTREQVNDTLAAMNRRPVGFDPIEHDVTDAADTESHAVVDDLLAGAVQVMEGMPLATQFSMCLTFYYGMTVRQAAETMGMAPEEVTVLQQQGVLAVHEALARAARGRDELP
jgi:RNA polymerase sigma factor (sigma-70 family)